MVFIVSVYSDTFELCLIRCDVFVPLCLLWNWWADQLWCVPCSCGTSCSLRWSNQVRCIFGSSGTTCVLIWWQGSSLITFVTTNILCILFGTVLRWIKNVTCLNTIIWLPSTVTYLGMQLPMFIEWHEYLLIGLTWRQNLILCTQNRFISSNSIPPFV